MNRILIIGATGTVGRQVAAQLAAAGARVRAMSRKPESAKLPAEVEVVGGDLEIPASLDAALDGVDSVFLVWTASAAAIPCSLERITKQARRIVFLSSPYQTAHPFFQRAQPNLVSAMHAEIERVIKASGKTWTFLRSGMFAANARGWWGRQIRAGDVVRWPYALAPTAPIHERDIAAVAVRALSESIYAGRDYVLTGPQSLSQRDQVATIGEVLGRALRFEEITREAARRELGKTMPEPVVNMLLAAWAGAMGQPALVTSAVADVTGTPPRTFREWAKDNAAEFRSVPLVLS